MAPAILEAVKAENAKGKTLAQIQAKDEEWKAHAGLADNMTAIKENMEISWKAAELVDEIATASGEQAQGIQQLSLAASEMDKEVQRISASAEESVSTTEEMNSQAMAVSAITPMTVNHGIGGETTVGVLHRLSSLGHRMTNAIFPSSVRREIARHKTDALLSNSWQRKI